MIDRPFVARALATVTLLLLAACATLASAEQGAGTCSAVLSPENAQRIFDRLRGSSSDGCFLEGVLIYPGLLLSLEAGWLLPADQGPWRQLARGMLRRLRPHALLFPVACVWGIRQGLSALSSREVTFAASNVFDQAGWLLSGAAVPQLAGLVGHRAAGAVVLSLLVLAIVQAPRRPSIQRTAALCALVVTLPMLWLEHRMFPGYLVQPWPWITLTAVGAMSESRSWSSRALSIAWVGMWFVSTPVLREHQSCMLNEQTFASLRSQEAAACERDWPVWHTTAPVTKGPYVQEANRGMLEAYRLWCGKKDVRIEFE